QSPSPVVKLGTWGGDDGVAHDITVAPQRLESITIRWGKVLDSVGFTYRDKDKQLHTAGPWGGAGGEKEDPDTVNHPGAVGVHNPSRLVGGAVQAQGDRALHHLDQVCDQPGHLRPVRAHGGQHALQPARAQQRQRRRHVRPRRRLPPRHRLLRPPLLIHNS
uniref:Jacalin-type lectin domain-containing protein n=1 Tax=Aegilops tauschii subsp. strangulata TaxID=200361 RepID=A0A453QY92_AEGTS